MANKLIPGRKLIASAIKDFWKHRSKVVGTLAVVAVPLILLNVVSGLGQTASTNGQEGNTTVGSYSAFASFIMTSGLIWLISQIKHGNLPSISDVYYRGTASLVRFILLVFIFFLVATPFLIGALFYSNGLRSTVPPGTGEKMLLAIIWAVLALPSFFLITRFFLAIYVLIDQDSSPIQSLGRSNQLIKGKTFKAFGRLITICLGCILALTLLVLASRPFVSSPGLEIVFQILLQATSVMVVLPIANFYLFNLYQELESKSQR